MHGEEEGEVLIHLSVAIIIPSVTPFHLGGMNVRFFEHGVSFTHKSIGCNVLSWAKDVAYVKLLHAQNMEKIR